MARNLEIIIITLHPLSYLLLSQALISESFPNVKETLEEIYKQEPCRWPPSSSTFGHLRSPTRWKLTNFCSSQDRLVTITPKSQWVIKSCPCIKSHKGVMHLYHCHSMGQRESESRNISLLPKAYVKKWYTSLYSHFIHLWSHCHSYFKGVGKCNRNMVPEAERTKMFWTSLSKTALIPLSIHCIFIQKKNLTKCLSHARHCFRH